METTLTSTSTALRAPLWSEEAEQACLASALISTRATAQLTSLLTPRDFLNAAHQKIAHGIWHLARQSRPVDLTTLLELLKRHECLEEVGGAAYLLDLLDRLGTTSYSAHVEHYARIVAGFSLRRKLEEFAASCQRKARDLDLDPEALPAEATLELLQLQGRAVSGPLPLGEFGNRELARLRNRKPRASLLTGLGRVDRLCGGLERGDTGLIIGRPGKGKTVALMQLAEFAADHWGPGAFFALEMTGESVWDRLLSGVSGISYREIRDAGRWEYGTWQSFSDEEMEEIESATQMIQRWTGKVHLGTAEHEIDRLIYAAQRLRLEHGIQWLMIDYGGLLVERDAGRRGRAEEQTRIAVAVKNEIAKRLDMPVWIGIQATPDVEKEGTRAKGLVSSTPGKKIDRPIGMGDVSWAQQWVRDCSVAFALNPDPNPPLALSSSSHRPELDLQRPMLWNVLKARNGVSGVDVPVWFRTAEYRFTEREYYQPDPGPQGASANEWFKG